MSTDIFKARQASQRLNKLKITTNKAETPYLFVSYKSDDWSLALEEIVYTMQKTYGLSIYYDRNFEEVNDNWVKVMQSHLTSPWCMGVVAFISRNYVRSYATLLEILTSQRDKCAQNGQPMPIISVFLQNNNFPLICAQAEVGYSDAKTGIKKTEWDALMACINNFKLPKNQITPQDVKDACAEIAAIQKGSDLEVTSVISCFEKMEDVVADPYKIYGGERFYKALRDTIDSEGKKIAPWKQQVFMDPNRNFSVFDPSLINLDDLRIPRTDEPAEAPAVPAPAAPEPPAPAAPEPPAIEEPETPQEDGTAAQRRASVTGDIRYSIYGAEYEENQSDMMLRVFAQVLKRHPEFVDTLPQQAGMNCAAKKQDIVSPNTKDAKPSYFRVCREFTFDNGQSVCIGTAYGSADKMKKIARLLEICGESRDVFQSAQVSLPDAPKRAGRPAAKEAVKPDRVKKEKNFLD